MRREIFQLLWQAARVMVPGIVLGCWLFTLGLGRSFFYRAQWKEDLPQLP